MIQSLPVVTRRHVDSHPDPNLQALQLINRDYLSYSAISTYQRCPLKFFFSYVAQLEPEFKSSSLIFGSAIHAAIEEHFVRLFEGRPAPSLDDLLVVYDRAWNSESTLPIRFGKSETELTLRDLAGRMLAAFQADQASKLEGATSRLIGVEETLRAPIIADCPDVLGRLDLITAKANALAVADFKTARSRWNAAQINDAAPQQLLYADLVKPLAESLGCDKIEINWIVITKTKQPVVERHTLTPDARLITRTKSIINRVWNAIRGGHFYPSPSAMNCALCPYRKPCQRWEG